MAETTLTLGEILRAQAEEKRNKSLHRVKSVTLMNTLVQFVNDGEDYMQVSDQFPTINATRWNNVIKSNKALDGIVYALKTDDLGVVLVNTTK